MKHFLLYSAGTLVGTGDGRALKQGSTTQVSSAIQLVKRAANSTLILLVVFLAAIDLTILTVRPLKYVTSLRYIPLDQNPVVSKVPEFFASPKHPDVLILGSSVMADAIARWDSLFNRATFSEPDNPGWREVRLYTDAQYLSSQFVKTLGVPLRLFNLTCTGCMVSDAYLLLSRSIDAGKAPKIVIWGIAPRDFTDNLALPLGKTPVYEVLADWRCAKDLLSRETTPDEVRDFFVSSLWYYYKVKADYRTLISTATCDLLGHQASLHAAMNAKEKAPTHNARPGHIPSTLMDKSLAEYQERYNPPDFRRFEAELGFLKKTIRLCRDNGIRLVVLNMPITDRNRQLINAEIRARYRNEVCNLLSREAHLFVDLDGTKMFSDSDFFDSAHTNSRGGKKVQDSLLMALSKTAPI